MEPGNHESGPVRRPYEWPSSNYQELRAVMSYHHHHLYEFVAHELTESLPEDPIQPSYVHEYRDHNGFGHVHCHVHKLKRTDFSFDHYSPYDQVKMQVLSSTLFTKTALFIEKDHLRFHHQFVHLHKIFCREMWPEVKNPEGAPDREPLDYRVFFPDLQTRTTTKTGVFVHEKGEFLEFEYYHSHCHILAARCSKHPDSFKYSVQVQIDA
ncbi:hypothetical protein KP509_36G003000 [Ceratopteris richardii]|uniref:Uncharacterized protein n=1 Tax=Ceratopteris richardii TaxID=49495 RepID=A0A8T2QA00_CERRI|nr:hypothetical protein KP509_36G003000 [Ceratopteris richardii]